MSLESGPFNGVCRVIEDGVSRWKVKPEQTPVERAKHILHLVRFGIGRT